MNDYQKPTMQSGELLTLDDVMPPASPEREALDRLAHICERYEKHFGYNPLVIRESRDNQVHALNRFEDRLKKALNNGMPDAELEKKINHILAGEGLSVHQIGIRQRVRELKRRK